MEPNSDEVKVWDAIKAFLLSKTFSGLAIAFLSWLLPTSLAHQIELSVQGFQYLVGIGVVGGIVWACYGKFKSTVTILSLEKTATMQQQVIQQQAEHIDKLQK